MSTFPGAFMIPAPRLQAADPQSADRRPVILAVDDDPDVLSALRRCLRTLPYAVLTAESADEALQILARRRVDLVLADQRMPGLCGADLLVEVRRQAPRAHRLLLTGFPGQARVRSGLGSEIEGLIAKPWSDEGLRMTLGTLLQAEDASWKCDPW